MNKTAKNLVQDGVGLCAACTHGKRIVSERGAEFWLCQLSRSDPRFPRYPRLPVLSCEGYEASAPSVSPYLAV